MNLGYSPLSAIDRKIIACPQYDKYFPKPKHGLVKKLLDANGGVEETVKQMMRIVETRYKEVEGAKHLVKGKNVYQTAKNIFDFLFKHIKYNLERGEILNTPAASYHSGQRMARLNPNNTKRFPVDCDDFSIFAASFLKALGLPYAFRIASYDGMRFSHVYCIVPTKPEIIIDPVYHTFNREKPYAKQKTFIGGGNLSGMSIHYQGISGLGDFDQNIIELAGGMSLTGLGSVYDDDAVLLGYLESTLAAAKSNPFILNESYSDPKMFIGMLEKAISGLSTKDEIDIITELMKVEQKILKGGISGLQGSFIKDELYPYDKEEISGLQYVYKNGCRYVAPVNGFFGALGFFRKLRNKVRNFGKKVKSFGQKINNKVNLKQHIRNIGKAFMKLNPVTLVVRNSLRLLLRLNFKGVSGKLLKNKHAYNKVLALYDKMGGKTSKIKDAIRKGGGRPPMWQKKVSGLGEPVSMATAVASAGGIVAKIFSWLKERREEKKELKEQGFTNKDIRLLRQNNKKAAKEDKKKGGLIDRAISFIQNQNKPQNSQTEQSTPYLLENQEVAPNTNAPIQSWQTPAPKSKFSTKKIMIGVGAIAGLGVIALMFNKSKNTPSTARTVRLQGVKLK